jgi:hypothetical protein
MAGLVPAIPTRTGFAKDASPVSNDPMSQPMQQSTDMAAAIMAK